MLKSLHAAIAVAALSVAPFASALCIQDQYGNQYEITLNPDTKSITGAVTIVQLGGVVQTLSGSYVFGEKILGRIQQLTFADPSNPNRLYMLKGNYPKFGWYYDGVYDATQDSVFGNCTVPRLPAPAAGGRAGVLE